MLVASPLFHPSLLSLLWTFIQPIHTSTTTHETHGNMRASSSLSLSPSTTLNCTPHTPNALHDNNDVLSSGPLLSSLLLPLYNVLPSSDFLAPSSSQSQHLQNQYQHQLHQHGGHRNNDAILPSLSSPGMIYQHDKHTHELVSSVSVGANSNNCNGDGEYGRWNADDIAAPSTSIHNNAHSHRIVEHDGYHDDDSCDSNDDDEDTNRGPVVPVVLW
jgi:hypothetical protein